MQAFTVCDDLRCFLVLTGQMADAFVQISKQVFDTKYDGLSHSKLARRHISRYGNDENTHVQQRTCQNG